MLGYSPNPHPFTNKGLTQRADRALIFDGEYSFLENLYSEQEGLLTIRTGHKRLTTTAVASQIVSLSKLNLGGTDANNPRYLGEGTKILRTNSAYTTADISPGFVTLTSGARWQAQQYNAGTSGTPALFLATDDAAMRDNGTYTSLQYWGIDPPTKPAQVIAANPPILNANGSGFLVNSRFVPSTDPTYTPNSNASGEKTLTAASYTSVGGGLYYAKLTPTATSPINGTNGITPGMMVDITDGVHSDDQVVVVAVGPTYFYCYTTFQYVFGSTTVTSNSIYEQFTIGTAIEEFITGLSINAAFGGAAPSYDSDDPFHISVFMSDPTHLTSMQLRIYPNYTGVAADVGDYYLYTISPAQLNVPSATTAAWTEFFIPKTSFTKMGNAGTGAFTWANITQIAVEAFATTAALGADSVAWSSFYFQGGYGLNDNNPGTTAYNWIYTLRNPLTGAESNPSQPLIDGNLPPALNNGSALLTIPGIDTSTAGGYQDISGPGSIAIYRSGGSFSDGLYRLVGFATNPGSGSTVQYTDSASDASLDTAKTAEFDNDPPVRSSLKVALSANILAFQSAGGSGDTSTNTANTTARLVLSNLPTGFPSSAMATTINIGTPVVIGTGTTSETAIVSLSGYNTTGHATSPWIEVFLQYSHQETSANASEVVSAGSTNRGKVDIVWQEFDSLFVAGDANNPATLYQSKVGRPEAFPVINLENGFAQQINVGSPANPIMGLASLNGELISMNLDNIFIIQVWGGQMLEPIKSQSSRGLYAKYCWARGLNSLWFMSSDGIYSWNGGDSLKISERIDFLFRNKLVNGIYPIDFTQASKFSMAFSHNMLFFVYIDTQGSYRRLKYEPSFDRWTMETVVTSDGYFPITSAFTEPDTDVLLFGVQIKPANTCWLWWYDFYSTSDGWTSAITDGTAITYSIRRDWPCSGDMGTDFQIGEIVLEMANPANAVSAYLYYNYEPTTQAEIITISSGSLATRGRFIKTVNSGTPQTAYAIGLALFGSSGTGSGPVYFYTFSWRELKLEEPTTGPTTDWMDFGYTYDKLVYDITMQYDTGGQTITVYLDTITGITGNTQNLAVATYTLTGTGRSQQVFLVPDATIVKMMRLRPANATTKFKFWQWTPRFDKLPPDSITASQWSDSGYGCPKVFNSLDIQVDTGGVAASVALQVDGSTVNTFSVTGTFLNRASVITLPSNISGIEWRLVPTPGSGGKFQLYNCTPHFVKQPCPITHFDSLEQPFGYAGYKFLWQAWIEYKCAGTITVSIYTDNFTLFYQKTLPIHTNREVARFYFPLVNMDIGGTPINKSKTYRVIIDAVDTTKPFQIFNEGSSMDYRNLDGDQRFGYLQGRSWLQPQQSVLT